MTQAFDAQNPPFDRLTQEQAGEQRAGLDIGYFAPGQVVIEQGEPVSRLALGKSAIVLVRTSPHE